VEERRWTLSERFYLGPAAIVVALLTEEGLDDAAVIGRPPVDLDQDYSNRRCI
jgi:hypothetical protein